MNLSRRDFLHSLSVMAALSAFGRPAELLAATFSAPAGRYVVGAGNDLLCYNLATQHVARIDLGFDMHSASPHATNPDLVWTLGKLGSKGALVDLKAEKVVAPFIPPKNMVFYGHAAHDGPRNLLYAACVDYTTRAGHLAVYDLGQERLKGSHYVCGGPLHDLHVLPDGNILAAVIEMERYNFDDEPTAQLRHAHKFWHPKGSAISWLDGETYKTIKQNKVDDLTQAVTHTHLLPTGGMIAVAAPWGDTKAGAFYFTPDVDKPMQQVVLPADIQDKIVYEFLSVAIDKQRNIAAVTNPEGQNIVYVDTRTGTYLGHDRYPYFDIAFDDTARQFMAGGAGAVHGFNLNRSNVHLTDGLAGINDSPLVFTGAHSMII